MSWRTQPDYRTASEHRTASRHRTVPVQRPPDPPFLAVPSWLPSVPVRFNVYDLASASWASGHLGAALDNGIDDMAVLFATSQAFGSLYSHVSCPIQIGWKGWNHPSLSAGHPPSGTYAGAYANQPWSSGQVPSGASGNYGYLSLQAAGDLAKIVSFSYNHEYSYAPLAECSDGTHFVASSATSNAAALAAIEGALADTLARGRQFAWGPDYLWAGSPTGFGNWGALANWTSGDPAIKTIMQTAGVSEVLLQSQRLQTDLAAWVASVPAQIAAAHSYSSGPLVILQFNVIPPTYTAAQIAACLATLKGSQIPDGISLFASAAGGAAGLSACDELFTAFRNGPYLPS